MPKRKPLHAAMRKALGVPSEMTDGEFWHFWNNRATRVCKPCWELKYCPYGPLVEQSPLLPITLSAATEHRDYAQKCLTSGTVGHVEKLPRKRRAFLQECVDSFDANEYESDPTGELTAMQLAGHASGKTELTREAAMHVNERMKEALLSGVDGEEKRLTPEQRRIFEDEVSKFNPKEYPETIPRTIAEMCCTVFGHICPVVFNAEKFTETTDLRRSGRYIPFKTKIRVVRRDNYSCQHCGKHLLDNEVEFDHVIPVAKGGSSEEHNIRLTCYDCNRDKSDKVAL